ncbi:membrane metallo-endopeptidase-like 1 [Rhipicephalus sanguineus]|uniref:membrane metallo-endopeptidase-like 1 n=1 Tax=Rhipicephalus sanguineus TaxID=34632 RepID=UPI0020C50532|nr:membrane metallo-endopeptidase-like 1 [Rhipicephalus sanguineus]
MVDLFVDWFVENDKLAAIRAMSAALWKATESIITDLSWIDETTRKKGLEHIRRLGHADMFTTVHDAHARRRLELLKGTKPSVRQEDLSSDDLVNASTCHSTGSHGRHHVRPFYTLTVPESVNYGALGHVVGHEVTHSYDPVLGVFKRIRLKDDWYGDSALSENFADCGGLEKVMRALRELGPQPGVTLGEHSFTAQQAFFVSSCFKWCAKYVPKPAAGEQPDDIAKIYSPLNMRCNVPLMNTAFADAFGCAPGTIMSPKVRCQLF